MKRLTSSDIARLAGVSRSTVSRVINDYPNVPEETRQRVMAVIQEQHYYPQLSGKLLAGKEEKTLGIFWIGSSTVAQDSLSSSYFMYMLDAASDLGYLVLARILPNLREESICQFVRNCFLEGRIRAGIFVGVEEENPFLHSLIEEGERVGVFDFPPPASGHCVTANCEEYSGDRAVDYLFRLGHREIGMLTGRAHRYTSRMRQEGYLRAMHAHGLTVHPEWIVTGDITQEGGYRGMRALWGQCNQHLPTALVANNDAVALGAYRACEEIGLRIPEDLSIIGIDGHSGALSVQPNLTTFAFDYQAMFTSLVERTIRMTESEAAAPHQQVFRSTLMERASCRKIGEA